MKKIFVIIIMFSFLLQTGGMIILLRARQLEYKREMKSRLRSNPDQAGLQEFGFALVNGEPSAKRFEWEDDGEEFRFNGSIYDVIEKRIIGNILYIRCIDDKDEASLVKIMDDIQKKNRRGRGSWSSSMQQLLNLQLFIEENDNSNFSLQYFPSHFDSYSKSLTPVVLDIISPPPRV